MEILAFLFILFLFQEQASSEITAQEEQGIILRDAWEKVRLLEEREGEDSLALATALDQLAEVLYEQGKLRETQLKP